MRIDRIEEFIVVLGVLAVLAWAARSTPSALSAGAGAALALASFVGTRVLASSLLSGGAAPKRAAVVGGLKWVLVAGALAAAWSYRVPVDALALATGISCLPAAIVCEALLWSLSGRAHGTRV